MSKRYAMNIDVVVQRGYRQPLDIIDTFKLRWNILFPFRKHTDELLGGTIYKSIEQLTHFLMGKQLRQSLNDNCLYISIGTATSFIKVLEKIKNNTDRYITKEEFHSILAEAGIYASDKDLSLILDRYDK